MRKVAGSVPTVDGDGWWLRFPWGRATIVMFGLGVAKNVAIELVGAPTPLYLALLVLVDLAFVACLGATIMRWRPGNLAVWGAGRRRMGPRRDVRARDRAARSRHILIPRR